MRLNGAADAGERENDGAGGGEMRWMVRRRERMPVRFLFVGERPAGAEEGARIVLVLSLGVRILREVGSAGVVGLTKSVVDDGLVKVKSDAGLARLGLINKGSMFSASRRSVGKDSVALRFNGELNDVRAGTLC